MDRALRGVCERGSIRALKTPPKRGYGMSMTCECKQCAELRGRWPKIVEFWEQETRDWSNPELALRVALSSIVVAHKCPNNGYRNAAISILGEDFFDK